MEIESNNLYEERRVVEKFIENQKLGHLSDYRYWLNLEPIRINDDTFKRIDLTIKSLVEEIKNFVMSKPIENLFNQLDLSNIERKYIISDLSISNNLKFFRPDICFESGKYRILELNTENPGGYGDLAYLEEIVSIFSHQKIDTSANLPIQLSKLITKSLLNRGTLHVVYKNQDRDKDRIVETRLFLNKYLKADYPEVQFCPLDSLEIENSALKYNGTKVNGILRLFDLADLLNSKLDKDKFLDLYNNGSFSIFNPLSDALFGNKVLLSMVFEAKDLINSSSHLEFGNIKQVDSINNKILIDNKDKYVLKKGFSSRGEQVIFGIKQSMDEWNEILKKSLRGWVVQEVFNIDKGRFKSFDELWKISVTQKFFDFLPFYVEGSTYGAFSRFSNDIKTSLFRSGGGVGVVKIS